MGIFTEVESCSYTEVELSNKEIIKGLDKNDAEKVIIGLIKKFPDLVNTLFGKSSHPDKIFPKAVKDQAIKKHREENKQIEDYFMEAI